MNEIDTRSPFDLDAREERELAEMAKEPPSCDAWRQCMLSPACPDVEECKAWNKREVAS